MTISDKDRSQIRYAKLAGLMFLVVDAAYALGLFITSRFAVPGNFVETAHRIMGDELLYRVGISSLLIGALCTVFLAMDLYGAVKPVDNNLALLALVLRLAEATIFGVMSVFSFAGLELYLDPRSLKAFDPNQLSVLVNQRLVAASAGFNIAAIFFLAWDRFSSSICLLDRNTFQVSWRILVFTDLSWCRLFVLAPCCCRSIPECCSSGGRPSDLPKSQRASGFCLKA